MKEITTTLKQYEAEDGTLFLSATTCKVYEQRLKNNKIEEEYKNLKKKVIHLPLTDYRDECDIILVKLNNEHDFQVLKDYYDFTNENYGNNYLNDYENLTFPCIKAVYDCEEYTDFCYDGHKQTDTEMLIDELSKAIIEINNF